MDDLSRQIEAAFDYRGHVTVTLKDGSTVEGFLFNRQLASPLIKEPPFVELFLKDGVTRRKLAISELKSVSLTGENFAAPFKPKA